MDFMIEQDIESVLEITGFTIEELAEDLCVSRITVSNWINNKNNISEKHMCEFYEYVFKKGIRLNKIKEQFYREDMVKDNEVLLFHGAKTMIEGNLRLDCNKRINDFGDGFYCGESLEQSAMFVATHRNSSLYMLKFDPSNLVCREFSVNREWILTIAYYRGRLDEYANTEIVEELHWIGYIYRYWAYISGKSSKQIYKIMKPEQLKKLYLPYHSLDPLQAIERIIDESESESSEEIDDISRGVIALRKVRNKKS